MFSDKAIPQIRSLRTKSFILNYELANVFTVPKPDFTTYYNGIILSLI